MEHNYVRITFGNRKHYGQVISASNYGKKDLSDWYIEFKCAHCQTSHYMKQQADGMTGATVEFFETEADLNNAVLNDSPLGRAFYQPWEY